ncbi:hypothetical protein Cme02nite_00520 [Catellatospora methionotrophica]|uniref:Uncharacterized protein n=1 Tax=Catellatospora methionotrophica TaxID=121620 RepID=A0A8J3L3B7_9ACTN|nr:hypothetical protein [Catellatospora methionotrophica]GIG11720.1 hypothetical protein Cme02nite_00520 [Catellatospora methionotrophica]
MRRLLAAGIALTVSAGLMAAVGGTALARPNCDVPVPPPACDDSPTEPPPPPVGTDKYPMGWLESWQYLGGAVRVTGWASDPNGGPVQISVIADAPSVGTRPANLWHAGRGAYVGFDITVPTSALAGLHGFCVTANNVPDGSQPVPEVAPLSCPQYRVEPAAPSGLILTPGYHEGKRTLDVTFTDNSVREADYRIELSWLQTTPDDTPTDPGLPTTPPGGPSLPIPQPTYGAPIPTTEVGVARAVIYGTTGTGQRTWHFTHMPQAFVHVVVVSHEAGLTSAALSGGVSTR